MEPRAYTLRDPGIAARMRADVMRLPCDGTWRVLVQPVDETRTDAQNRRYWAGVIGAAQQWIEHEEGRRLSKDVIHEWLKQERFGLMVEMIKGRVQHVPRRTRTMNKREFSAFADWAEAFVMEQWGVPAALIDGLHQESA